MLLEALNLSVRYGRIRAVADATVAVERGEVVAVLGANGAGKSSLLKAVLGVVKPVSGRVTFDGIEVTSWPTNRRVQNGLVLVPEGRRILTSLTVHENLLMGAYTRRDTAGIDDEIRQLYSRFPNLAERRNLPASVLSGGEQQMLAIGRAILAKPKVMMLDEPSLGLSPLLVGELFSLLGVLNREGITILLVEQNTRKALQVADRAYVFELGHVVLEGLPNDLLADRGLQEAYLGQTTGRDADLGARPGALADPGPSPGDVPANGFDQ